MQISKSTVIFACAPFLIFITIITLLIVMVFGYVAERAAGLCKGTWRHALNLVLMGNTQKTFDEICEMLAGTSGGGGESGGGGGVGGWCLETRLDREALRVQLEKDEGSKLYPYTDSLGVWTIGIGHNLEGGSATNFKEATGQEQSSFVNQPSKSITEEQISALFNLDIAPIEASVQSKISNYADLPSVAKQIVIEIAFQVGTDGFAKHEKMIQALEKYDYITAAAEIADSERYDQLNCQNAAPSLSRTEAKNQILNETIQIDDQKSCRVLRQAERMMEISGDNTGCSINSLSFPIVNESFASNANNFGNHRETEQEGDRCHVGVDLNTTGAGEVVAITDGKVNYVGHFYDCEGKSVDMVLIEHIINGEVFTINYGEINSDTVQVKKGDTVVPNQFLGNATNCKMLHFEMYQGSRTTNETWLPGKEFPEGEDHICVTNNFPGRPGDLLDPTDFLKKLELNNQIPSGTKIDL